MHQKIGIILFVLAINFSVFAQKNIRKVTILISN